MKNKPAFSPKGRRPSGGLLGTSASQFGMTPHETKLVTNIIQHKDFSMESLKHPKIQQIIKQRKGRWVKEEEDYANFLSHEFCIGLSDIENGTTKRSFLSTKLNCTKMRISKKFKGQTSGKEVFERKSHRSDGKEFSQHERAQYRQRHIDLEKQFIRATLHSVLKTGMSSSQRKKSYSPTPTLDASQPRELAHDNDRGQINIKKHSMPQADVATSSPNIEINAQSIKMSCPPSAEMQQSSTLPHQFVNQMGATMQVQENHAIQVQDCKFENNVVMSLPSGNTRHDETARDNTATAFPPVQSLAHNNHHDTLHYFDVMQIKAEEEGSNERHISDLMTSVGYGFPPLLDNAWGKRFKHIPPASQAVSTSTSEPSSNDESDHYNSASLSTEVSSSLSKPSSAAVKSESLPDLLSGFDKEMMKKKNAVPIPDFFAGAGGLGESPYITSRSFDELHKFGAGLSSSRDKMSHLDLNHHPAGNLNPPDANFNDSWTGIPASVGLTNAAVAQVPSSHHNQSNLNAPRQITAHHPHLTVLI